MKNSIFCNCSLISRQNSIESNFERFWALCVFSLWERCYIFSNGALLVFLRAPYVTFAKTVFDLLRNYYKFVRNLIVQKLTLSLRNNYKQFSGQNIMEISASAVTKRYLNNVFWQILKLQNHDSFQRTR